MIKLQRKFMISLKKLTVKPTVF